MAGHYRNISQGRGITTADFSKKPAEEIPFTITVKGKNYSGTISADGKTLPSGVPGSFICFIKGEPPTRISYIDNAWSMSAGPEFVEAISAFIIAWYQ